MLICPECKSVFEDTDEQCHYCKTDLITYEEYCVQQNDL